MSERLNNEKAELFETGAPENQLITAGKILKDFQDYGMVSFRKAITADATSGVNVFDSLGVPFDIEIIDIVVQARATSGSGTVQLSDGTNNISDAVAMATDTNITRAGTLNDAYSALTKGDQLILTTNGAADRGFVTIVAVRND
jgi:hypothetical protein